MGYSTFGLSAYFILCLMTKSTLQAKKEIHIAALLPFEGQFNSGKPCSGSYSLAEEDVRLSNVLPDHELVIHMRDTKCSPGLAVYQMHELLFNPPTKTLLLGPICSDCCVATAGAAVYWNITQTTPGCGTPVLSDKAKFPLFMRVNTPDVQANVLRIRVLKEYNWTRFAIVSTSQDLFELVVRDLIQRADVEKMRVLTSQTLTGDYVFTLDRVKQSEARIIFLFLYALDGMKLLCAAYHKGLYGSRYVYIFPGWWGADPFNQENDLSCTLDQLHQVTQYSLGIAVSFVNPHMDKMTEYGFTAEEGFTRRYADLNITEGTQLLNLNCYDVIWTIAYGVRAVIERMQEENYTKPLDEFTYEDGNISRLLWEEMTNLDYTGVRGPVGFAQTGDALGFFKFDQFRTVDGKMALFELAVQNPLAEASKQLVFSEVNEAKWHAGRPPKDSIVVETLMLQVSVAEYLILAALALAGLCVTVFFMAFNVYHRKKRFIKMSSPNLNNIALFGCAIMYVSVFFADLGPTMRDDGTWSTTTQLVFCKMRSILASFGFSIAFGALFSKTYRVHRIFLNKKLQRRIVKDTQLFAMVGTICLIDAVIFVIWEIVDSRTAEITAIEEKVVDEDTIEVINVTKCDSMYSMYFMSVLYGIKGILLIFGAFLSWETRKVNVPELNDSKNIGLCIYNVIVVSLLAVGMSFALQEDPQLTYLIGSLCTVFATTFTTCMIFVPKVTGIMGGKVGAEQMSEGTIGTIHVPVAETSSSAT